MSVHDIITQALEFWIGRYYGLNPQLQKGLSSHKLFTRLCCRGYVQLKHVSCAFIITDVLKIPHPSTYVPQGLFKPVKRSFKHSLFMLQLKIIIIIIVPFKASHVFISTMTQM